ncbi:Vms1/Ankzf1 family peptidyl-tRNA hydrolase [Halosimplex carlsbadense]|uniref:Vms1/Ankzf1 family peptidyl-tRNA hydrolase n=1 Tax=Halosimplex carlsbadense TaxID=171164 RepID=UPI000677D1D0|nr:Vms1/Ankzf1 family peptidyl-tRNA hydrolase [Halosimplex carlsbadense]
MLDRVLGRAELKERIAELEDELDSREQQLEAEQRRRADAASDRQDAEERVNRLEDRIAELEGEVERLRDGQAGADRSFAAEETLRDGRLRAVLDRLESVETDPEGAFTAYVPDGHDLSEPVREAFGDRAALVGRAAPCLAVTDDAALVDSCLSVPNPPEPFAEWSDAFAFDRSWFEPTGSFTFALVRSDLFAMGEYDGDERVAFQGFDSELKSQHSKGGYSQARFERLRDEQIENHIERCQVALEDRETERLYVVGERTVLDEFEEVADGVSSVSASGEPEPALDEAFREFWQVRLRAL